MGTHLSVIGLLCDLVVSNVPLPPGSCLPTSVKQHPGKKMNPLLLETGLQVLFPPQELGALRLLGDVNVCSTGTVRLQVPELLCRQHQHLTVKPESFYRTFGLPHGSKRGCLSRSGVL